MHPAKHKPSKVDSHLVSIKEAFERLNGYRREGDVQQISLVSGQIDGTFKIITLHQDLKIFHLEDLLEFLSKEKSDLAGKYKELVIDEIISLKQKSPQAETVEIQSNPVTSTMILFNPGSGVH